MSLSKPVDFSTAKLLKEKGFKERTLCYYFKNNLEEPYLENGSSTDVEFRVDLEDLYDYHNNEYLKERCSAPTIAEVVDWLFEIHGIWVSVETFRYLKFNYRVSKKEKTMSVKVPFSFEVVDAGYDLESPTEAYEKAIESCLTKII